MFSSEGISRRLKNISSLCPLCFPGGLIHRVLACTHPITTEMALRVGKFAGNGPALWLRLQQAYDLWHAERRMESELTKIEPVKRIPFSQLTAMWLHERISQEISNFTHGFSSGRKNSPLKIFSNNQKNFYKRTAWWVGESIIVEVKFEGCLITNVVGANLDKVDTPVIEYLKDQSLRITY